MTAPATRRNAPDSPSVSVETGAHTTAGGTATLRAHARNLAPDPRELRVSVVGLEESWRPPVGIVPMVAADETVSLEIMLTPPAGAAPGDYPFLVIVESMHGPGAETTGSSRTVADAVLRVDGASDVVLSIEPAEVRGVRRKRVDVVVGNSGLGPAEVTLDAWSDRELDVDLSETSVLLGPAETVRIPATVRARVRLAGSRARYSYDVVATGRAAPRRVQGSFDSRAVLGSSAIRVTAVVAVMALWIAAVVIALPRISDYFTQDDASTAADGPTSTGPSGDGDAGGQDASGDGDGSGEGGGGESGGEDEGDGGDRDQADGVRVSGTVSGVDPDGVVIDVVPTSSLWSSGLTTDAATSRASLAPGKVAAASMPMAPVGSAQRLTTRTDDDGVWALSGLSTTSRYLVTISKAGFTTQRVVMTGAELAAAPLETAMEAGEGSMSGVVVGPGGPVGGVEITLTDGTTTVTTRTATTGSVGRWHVDGLVTPSTYLVTAAAADLGTQAELVPLTAAGSREVDLRLDAGVATISGEVVGVDSLGGVGGLGGITVSATDGTTTRTATTVTGDGAGRFLLPRLPVPASYTVTISGPGYSTVTRAVMLTESGISGWTISLTSSGGAVTGTVTDDAGAGITAAGLVLTHGSNTTAIYKTMSASDGSGTFRFAGVAPGTYVLSAEAFGHETTYAEVMVGAGGTVEVDLELRRIPRDGLVATSTIIGRVVDASTSGQITCPILAEGDECVVTATVTAEDIDGTSRTITSFAEPDDPYRLPATGSSVEGLLPGRYVVTITAPGYEPGQVTVTVPMGGEAEAADVALEPSPSLVGSVLPRTGVLAPGVCVVAQQQGSPPIADPCGPETPECNTATARCVALENGQYRMDRLSAGTYTVTVVGLTGGYVPPQPQDLHLLPGEVQRYDVVLERNGIVSVTAVRSDGSGSVGSAAGHYVRAEQDGEIVNGPVQVDGDGFAQLTNLPPGRYDIVGARTREGPAMSTTTVAIGLNQEISIQLILASTIALVGAYVGYQTAGGDPLDIEGATISVTGVTGYTGTQADYGEATFTTDADGRAMICTTPTPGCTASLGLVESIVDVRVSAAGFEDFSANGVPLSSLATVLLQASARVFSGTAALDPTGNPEGVRFEVTEAPPGVLNPSLEAAADGSVTFADQNLSINSIRPGWYTIVARLDGYTSVSQRFFVPVDRPEDPGEEPDPVPSIDWTLLRDARVGARAVDAVTGNPVGGAVMVLTGPNELTIERVATPRQTVVDFGTVPAGTGYSLAVNVAGYRPVTVPVEILPGATLALPYDVPLDRLGTLTGEVVTVLGDGWYQDLPDAVVTADQVNDSGLYEVTTRADGTYTVTGTLDQPGVAAGDWTLAATAEAHGPQPEGSIPPSSVTATAANGQTVTAPVIGLAAEGASLLVSVVDGEVPVGGLSAELVYSTPTGTNVVPVCDPDATGCQTDSPNGAYDFMGLQPITYTLFISGGGYMPLSTQVTLAAGESQRLLVPITAPTGSIQGQVLQTRHDGSTAPFPGTDTTQVVLMQGTTELGVSEISETGEYLLDDIGAGTYTVLVQEEAAGTSTTLVSRTVAVLSGQSAVLDLVLPLVSRPVQVDVTSTNGTDLAGGLVTLVGTVDGEPLTLGPQPLGRSATGFTATFTQVPPGTWQASVSGPAGHHGSYLGQEETITGSSQGTVTTSVDVAETELRLQIAPETSPRDPPDQVEVTATPPAALPDGIEVPAVTATLIPGSSDSVLYVPAIGWTLSVADPDGPWEALIAPSSVAAGVARVLAQVTLAAEDVATTTTITAPATVTIPDEIEVTVGVAPSASADPAPTAGEVSLQYRSGDTGPWTTVSPAVAISDTGAATLSVATTGWEPGDYSVRVSFEAPSGWASSTSTPESVTVSAAADDGGTDTGGAGTDTGGTGTDTGGTGTDTGGTGTDTGTGTGG